MDKVEAAAEIMKNIMKAIQQVMKDGEPTVLVFADAKITIEKIVEE